MTKLRSQAAEPAYGRSLVALSSLSLVLILLLVLVTPFTEMSGVLTEAQRDYRIYGYALLGLLQIALMLIRGWQPSLRIFMTPLIPFLIWAVLSLLWTQHIDLTSKRLVLLLLVYSGIFSGLCDLPHQRSLMILRLVLATALVMNFAAVFAVPDIGTHYMQGGNLWRGLMAHKNIAGMLCAFTVIIFAFEGGKLPVTVRLAVITGALIFLVQSGSKTAQISLPIALAAGGTITFVVGRNPTMVGKIRKAFLITSRALLSLAVLLLIILTLQRDLFLSFTNDTTAITTRGAIWRPMIQFYLDSPILGSGYGAYWDASAELVDQVARNRGHWKNVDQGHNGYLDLLVQVGLPGLALALFAMLAKPLSQLATIVGQQNQRLATIFAVIVFSLLENLAESSMFADDALGNAILLIALAQLHRIQLRSSVRATMRRRQHTEPFKLL